MIIRPYQKEILTKVRDGWKDYAKQLVISPTGSGKTICFSLISKEFNDNGMRSLILVDQDELVWQAIDKLERTTGLAGQAEKAEHCASREAPVVVATVQSMARRLAKWPADHFGLVIADEADKSITQQWQSVLSHFDKHAKVCGFTATPHRTDARNLGCYYDNIAAEVGLFDLINQKYLSPISVKMLPVKIDLNGVGVKGGDFDTTDLHNAVEPVLEFVAKSIKEHAHERKVMVFLPLIKTSQKFVEICRGLGLSAEHIDGESEDRKEKLQAFSDWKFDILANSSLLLRGYDEPAINCIVMLRPTKSVTLFTQAIGRGTRIDPIKTDLLLLDFLFATDKHRLVRPAHLIAKTEEEAEIITQMTEQRAGMPADVAEQMPLDLQQLAGRATKQREENLRKQILENTHKKGKFISAEEFALAHHSIETAEFEPIVKWHKEPITEGQLKYLKRAHIDPATVRGKGHASALLGIFFANQKLRMATPGQKASMRRLGHPNAENATEAEARKFFAGLRK